MSNIIGFIEPLGGTMFNKNRPLVVEDIPKILVSKVFLDSNKINFDALFVNRFCPDDAYFTAVPISGEDYNNNILDIFHSFQDCYYSSDTLPDILDDKGYIRNIVPIGLLTVPNIINLCFLGNIENNDFNYMQDKIFPFELSEENIYIVINIYKSEDKLCIDNTITTVSVIDKSDNSIKTYIRVCDEDKIWSDWLEYSPDISININFIKLQIALEDLYEIINNETQIGSYYGLNDIIYEYEGVLNSEYNINNALAYHVLQTLTEENDLKFFNNVRNNVTFVPKLENTSLTYSSDWNMINNHYI